MINFLKLWDKSREQYHEYALNFPQYKKTNEKLIKIANISPNQVIVDLACGTGLTTKEVLKNCSDVKKVYAIDFSEDMLNAAKEFVKSKKVAFIVADAQDLNKFISEKVDVVLCNSAFWQFQKQSQVLKAISSILKDDGIFVFNLNQQFFDFGKPEPNQRIIIETIFSEMKKIGYESSNKLKPKISKEKIEEVFTYAGLTLKHSETINIGPRKLEDFINFLKIPATATFFEDVPKYEQEQILSSAYEKLKNQFTQIENNKWIYFVFKKIPSDNN